MAIDIDNIPRTIDLVRNDSNTSVIPDGYPVLSIIDQTQLPYAEAYLHLTDWREAIEAIKQLKVRGAPAIGIAGAASVALAAAEFCETNKEASHDEMNEPADYLEFMRQAAERIAPARPTAVNLMHMVDAAMEIVEEEAVSGSSPVVIADKLYEFTKQLIVEDEDANRKMGEFGAALLEERSSVLTHCNAGSLATAFFGTALGVIYEAALQGKIEMVYADETRPLRQGARLTATVCRDMGFDVTVISDNMPAFVMQREGVDVLTTAADAICCDGHVVNKVGTFQNAIVAKYMGIPYFVTGAPDQGHPTVDTVHIEMRDPNFTLQAMGVRTAAEGVKGYYPAFDITPPHLVSGVVTDLGIYSPYDLHRYFTDGSIGRDNLVI